jgi:hypothetical protein
VGGEKINADAQSSCGSTSARSSLFSRRCSASFSDQIIGEQSSRFDERSQALPGLCTPAFKCRDVNLVALNSQVYVVADLETKSRAESCWYNNAAVSLDPGTTSKLCVGHFPASHKNYKATFGRRKISAQKLVHEALSQSDRGIVLAAKIYLGKHILIPKHAPIRVDVDHRAVHLE